MPDERLALVELGRGSKTKIPAHDRRERDAERQADLDHLIVAGRHERYGDRTTCRRRHCDFSLDTRLGTLNLKIPHCGPVVGFLEPRKTVVNALVSEIEGPCIAGTSMRRVDELAQAMGMAIISKSSVLKPSEDIGERAHSFLKRLVAYD